MAGRADRTAEDTVEYRLFPEIPDGLGEKETQKFLEETLDSYLVHLSRFLVDYIWQCEPLHLAVVAGTSGGYRPGGEQDVGRTSGRLSPGLISITARGRRTLCLDQGAGGGGVRDLVIDDISGLLWHLFSRLVNRVSNSGVSFQNLMPWQPLVFVTDSLSGCDRFCQKIKPGSSKFKATQLTL